MRKFSLLLAAVFICAAALFIASPKSSGSNDKFKRSQRPVANRYIVVLENETRDRSRRRVPSERANELANEYQGRVDKVFESAIEGYSVEMSEQEAERLSFDDRVKYVEEDSVIESQSIQTDTTWGLGRIDQRNWVYPLDTNYNYSATGAGVNVYVLDSGILTTHPDFGGRAFDAFDAYNDNRPISECNGDGTHVAGTIGSMTYGVAKGVSLYSVRVLPCSGFGTSSTVLAGLDWVTRNAVRPAVANMSLASVRSDAIEQAVRNSINQGITYVVAAGNYNTDACNYSPAHLAEAITVGSTDNRDYRDPSTNYGSCIDLFAPGVGIDSTWNTENTTFNMGGTSTASPHTAGAAALYLEANPTASPATVASALTSAATQNILTDLGQGSPNRFLYTAFSEAPPPNGGEIPCAGTNYSGLITVSGGKDYQSSISGFQGRPGTYTATLKVPPGAQFRLNLDSQKRARWGIVASSPGTGSTESVSYRGKNGTYRWRIQSLAGEGIYTLCSVTP